MGVVVGEWTVLLSVLKEFIVHALNSAGPCSSSVVERVKEVT